MKKRWIIRSIFISLLTLCVVAWVGSYRHEILLQMNGLGHGTFLGITSGQIYFSTVGIPHVRSEWHLYRSQAGPAEVQRWYVTYQHHVVGFAYQSRMPPQTGFVAMVPVWLPTLLSTLLLWYVWRKTRAKPIGGAFPVEPAKAEVK